MKKLLSVALTAMLLFNSCSLMPAEEALPKAPIKKADTVVEYTTSVAEKRDLSLTKVVNCSYRPAGSEQVTYQVGGETIAAIYVSAGDAVTKGQLLGELSMGTLDTDLQAAELTLQQTALDIAYIEDSWELTKKGLQMQIDDQDRQLEELSSLIDSASETDLPGYTAQKAALEKSLASLNGSLASQEASYKASLQQKLDAKYIAQKRMDELLEQKRARQLYAGMDGNISTLTVSSEGDIVYENGVFAIISDLDTSVFSVTGDDAAFFPIGEVVSVNVRDVIYEAVSVSAEELGLTAEENTAYLQLTDPLVTLDDGTNGQITVIMAASEQAVSVPMKAVMYQDGEAVLFILNEDGEKELRQVTAGITTKEGYTEIVSGLEEGETVVIKREAKK